MKKFFIVFTLFFSVFILISCGERYDPTQQLRLPLKITAQTVGNESVFIAEMTENECRVTFSGSQALSETELILSEDGNKATDGGFTRGVPEGIFPPQEMLFRALKLLCNSEKEGVKCENGVKYTIDETEIMVYYEKTTGVLTGIETEEGGRRFKFNVLSLEPYETQSNGAG